MPRTSRKASQGLSPIETPHSPREDWRRRAGLLAATIDSFAEELMVGLYESRAYLFDLRAEVAALRQDVRSLVTERRLLTVEQAAAEWQVTPKRIRRMMKDGSVRVVKLGDVTRIDTSGPIPSDPMGQS
jgi:hypothetical protein